MLTEGSKILFKFMPLEFFYISMDNWALKASYSTKVNDPLENVPAWASDTEVSSPDIPPFISFSEKMDMPAMWGHYADNAKGICMVFVFPVLAPQKKHTYQFFPIKKELKGYENMADDIFYHDVLLKMKYCTKRAKIHKNEQREIEQYGELLAAKASCWQYEKEMRLVLSYKKGDKCANGHMLYSMPMRYFAGVLIGPRCNAIISDIMSYIDLSFQKECERKHCMLYDRRINVMQAELSNRWIVHKTEYDPEHFRLINPFLERNSEKQLLHTFLEKYPLLEKIQ